MNTQLILAANDAGSFWNSPIGGTIQSLLVAVGIIVVLFALFKAVPKFIGGKVGDGLKALIGGLVVAAICFNPDLLTGFISIVGDMLGQGSDSIDEISNSGGSGGGR